MSALLHPGLVFRAMASADLDHISAIEQRIYEFPWTRGNFADSLVAGYACTALENDRRLIGYAILALAAGESHLLNLSIDAPWQGRGHGRALLLHQVDCARNGGARIMLLEVRPSNAVARALYRALGFQQITVRRGYYPAAQGREDALLMGLGL